jgi:hypothetical protein
MINQHTNTQIEKVVEPSTGLINIVFQGLLFVVRNSHQTNKHSSSLPGQPCWGYFAT